MTNRKSCLLLFALCVLAGANGARAASYEVLTGTLISSETGKAHALTGAFEATGAPLSGATLLVDDFALQAGNRSLTPNGPVEFDGLTPLFFLEIADQITLLEDSSSRRIGLIQMRSGGDLVASSEEEATFRFLDFRSGPTGGGRAIGRLEDGQLPRRLHLEGTLYEVDQTFRILRGPCALSPLQPSPRDGGTVIGRDGGVVLVATRVNPTPTLEQLGVVAPDGASLDYDAGTRELTITSEGNLQIDATRFELSGLTRATVRTAGSITITGNLTLPAGVVLRIEAQGDVVIEGEVTGPGGLVIHPPDIVIVPLCEGLRPIFPAPERAVGSFSLVASAARPIDIDVQPRRKHGRGLPWRPRWLPVAVLGSTQLDVLDIDVDSLRLGRDEAPPVSKRGLRHRRGRADRDDLQDLLVHFDLRDTGIAVGDTEVCLVAETHDGEILEGCDTIHTLPRRRPGRGHGASR